MVDVVNHHDVLLADGHPRDLAQVEAGDRVVAVAEHRGDVRDRLELVEHVVGSDVAGVQNRCQGRLRLEGDDRARVEPAVGVGDEPDANDAGARVRAVITPSPTARAPS